MDGDLTPPSLTPIDLRCRYPGCACATSAPGTLVTDGFAVAPEAGSSCPVCQHAWREPESLGVTKGPVESGELIT